MAYCKRKTRFIAERSAEDFIRRNLNTYFWTFTEPHRPEGVFWTKTEAERAFKPFKDFLDRNGFEHLVFWERQSRGAWHPHVLVNGRLDVNKVRPFMVKRGWGPIMKVRWVRKDLDSTHDGRGEVIGPVRLVRYLVKYLTKAATDDLVEARKKFFGGSARAKIGNVNFKWVPSVEPLSMLWFYGRQVWREAFGEYPTFKDFRHVVITGAEACNWLEKDPWWIPPP